MTQHADRLNLAPCELTGHETVTSSTAQQFEVSNALPADPTTEQALRIVEVSGALDFWLNPAEDVYHGDDGTPA
jgi:hypothetical protein